MSRRLNDERQSGSYWTIILPAIQKLPHWPEGSPVAEWEWFFDLEAMRSYTPVITYRQFSELTGNNHIIDRFIYLERYSQQSMKEDTRTFPLDIFTADDVRNSKAHLYYYQTESSENDNQIWASLRNVYPGRHARSMLIASVFSPFSSFRYYLQQLAISWEKGFRVTTDRAFSFDLKAPVHIPATAHCTSVKPNTNLSIMIDRFEHLFWDGQYGQKPYWDARRSLVWSKKLQVTAENFRQHSALIHPYIGVHLRRGDFLDYRKDQLPTLETVANTLTTIMHQQRINTIFLASDASEDEILQLSVLLPEFIQFDNPGQTLHPAEIAVVDQYLCSQSSYFIGTAESVFSRFIVQQRDILGFNQDNTYNVFSVDGIDIDTRVKHKLLCK